MSTNAGHRIGKSGWLERLDIGDVSLDRVPVTLVPETGLESKADGLLPGTLFDAIYFDHENDFVVLNPTPPSPRAPDSIISVPDLTISHGYARVGSAREHSRPKR